MAHSRTITPGRTASLLVVGILWACTSASPQGSPADGGADASNRGDARPDGGNAEGQAEASPAEAGSSESATAVCAQYVQCVAATNPPLLGSIGATYGATGTCWKDTATLCDDACLTGLRQNHAAFPDVAACPLCIVDADCAGGATPVCDRGAGECVRCAADKDCSAPTPACDLATHGCVACTASSNCPPATHACDPVAHACVQCVSASDCASPTPACDPMRHACVACTTSGDCSGATPVCADDDTCVECVIDEDCPAARPGCDFSNHCQCSAALCAAGQCGLAPTVCGGTVDCGSCSTGWCGAAFVCVDVGSYCDPTSAASSCSFPDDVCVRDPFHYWFDGTQLRCSMPLDGRSCTYPPPASGDDCWQPGQTDGISINPNDDVVKAYSCQPNGTCARYCFNDNGCPSGQTCAFVPTSSTIGVCQ